MGSWIKLYREISDHWLWRKKPFSPGQAWIDILIEANHRDNKAWIKGEIYECKRGQSLHSVKTWGNRWGWSRQQVRTFLRSLESDLMIIQKSTNKTTILTICNYDKYQDLQPAKQPALNQHLTSTQPALNHKQEYKNKRMKEEEKEKIKKEKEEGDDMSGGLPPRTSVYSEIFLTFWDSYCKITKQISDMEPAHREWKVLNQEERNKAMENIQSYYEDCLRNKRPAKMAKTYLRDRTFNNDFRQCLGFLPNGKRRFAV